MNNPMVRYENKVWGSVLHLFCSDHAAVSLLKLTAGFRCSRHYHRARINQFTVISGRVAIVEWYEGKAYEKCILAAGDTCRVLAGMEHCFRVLEPGEMIEVYWPAYPGNKVSVDDIVRIDEGGLDHAKW